MGDIMNIAALHDGGLPRVTAGIRGNRFRLYKPEIDRVDLVDPATGDLLRFRALFEFPDSTVVQERIEDIEELLDHLNEMITTDDYWAAISDDDGALLIDDASLLPIGDNWSLAGAIDDLRDRVTYLEHTVTDLVMFQESVESTLNYYDLRITEQERLMSNTVSQMNRLSAYVTNLNDVVVNGLNHTFIVDDTSG